MEMDSFVQSYKEGKSCDDCLLFLQTFISKNQMQFEFCNRGYPLSSKEKFISVILETLSGEEKWEGDTFVKTALNTLRILSRERKGLSELHSDKGVQTMCEIMQFAQYNDESEEKKRRKPYGHDIKGEAIKCLVNAVLNNEPVQKMFTHKHRVKGILFELRDIHQNDNKCNNSIEYEKLKYELQVLYLLTVNHKETATIIELFWENNGLKILLSIVRKYIKLQKETDKNVSESDNIISAEIFKIFFTVTAKLSRFADDYDVDNEEKALFKEIINIAIDLGLQLAKKKCGFGEDLMTQLMNVLFNLPVGCEDYLAFGRDDCEFITVIIDYIDYFAKKEDWKLIPGHLTAPLTLLKSVCRVERKFRIFAKNKILGEKRNFDKRPEEENNYRGHIVKLMTSHLEYINNLAAEFLFVLCKENMNRLINQTGYGNAAGLMANRALFVQRIDKSVYEDFSEDDEADLEEFERMNNQAENDNNGNSNGNKNDGDNKGKKKVNPVTGQYYKDTPNPINQMTEEEKEIEAEKLGLLFEKLNATGVIKVMGKDELGNMTEFQGPN